MRVRARTLPMRLHASAHAHTHPSAPRCMLHPILLSTYFNTRLGPPPWAAMLKRNTRLRKEYLYRKSLEGKERVAYERKRIVRKALEGKWVGGVQPPCALAGPDAGPPGCVPALYFPSLCVHQAPHTQLSPPCWPLHAEGKPIPNEVRDDERKLRHEVELEDDNTAVRGGRGQLVRRCGSSCGAVAV